MPEIAAVAVASLEQISIKPSVNLNAYYDYAEAEALGFGKYLKLRRAVRAGKLKAYFSGRNVRFKGCDLVAWLEGKAVK